MRPARHIRTWMARPYHGNILGLSDLMRRSWIIGRGSHDISATQDAWGGKTQVLRERIPFKSVRFLSEEARVFY